jgi:riboflavin synthase alpha subunit
MFTGIVYALAAVEVVVDAAMHDCLQDKADAAGLPRTMFTGIVYALAAVEVVVDAAMHDCL